MKNLTRWDAQEMGDEGVAESFVSRGVNDTRSNGLDAKGA
jgi:hypothetical protein